MTPVSPGSGAWLARLVVGAVLMLAGILAVVYLAARFVVWPNVDALAARYAGTMEARLGAPVTWKAIRTDWAGLRPSIEIDGAMVGSGDRAIRAERLFATISLRALLRGEADFHELRLDRPVVPVSRRGDELTLSALPARPERPDGGGGMLPWLLQQSDVRIGGGTLVLRDEDQPRRSLQLRDISLVLKSRGVEHDARLDVGSGDSLAANLVVQAALTRDPSRDPSDRRSWSGSLQWEARQLMLRPLLDQLPRDLAETLRSALPAVVIDSVRGRVDPWMSVQLDRGIVGDVRVRLRSDDLALMLADPGASKPAAAAGGLRFTRLGTDLRIRRTPAGGIELSTYGFELEEAGGAAVRAAAPPLALVLAPDRSLERLSGGFDTFEAEPVLRLVRMFAAARATQAEPGAIERVAAAGQVSGLKLAWQRPTQAGAAAWSVEGAFERASLEVTPDAEQRKFPFKIRVPSLRAVSGTFLASQSGGRATLRTPPRAQADASAAAGTAGAGSASPGAGTIEPGSTASGATAVTFGGVLAEPEVPFTSLDSRFAWKVDRGAGPAWLTLSVERFSFANADGKGAITGSYRSGGRGAGVVDFRARIDSLQAKQVWRYLPHEVPEGVRQWVREALEAGTLEDIEAAWRGDIRDFPYRSKSQDGPGEFHLAGKARDVLFKYAADWPAIHGIAGDFEFDRASLRLQAQRATAMEVALAGIEARIDDLAQGILALQGRAEGDAGHMVRFVNASPLAAALGDVTRAMSAKGAAKLALELRLPLRDMDAFTVRGDLDLAGATLDYEPVGAPLEAITGRLQFTGNSLAFNGVRARLVNAPMTLAGGTREGGRMQLTAEGRMTAESLRLLSGEPLSRHLSGSTAYKADIDLGPGGAKVSVTSDLVGLGSALPAPVGKAPDARMPLALTISPIEPRGGNGATAVAAERIEASVGDEVQLLAERERSDARRPMQLARAALAVNRQPTLPDAGVALQFTGQRIDLDAWTDAVAQPDASGAGSAGDSAGGPTVRDAPPTMPITVSLLADEVRVAGRNLSKVVLGASRHENQWLANLSAQQINGFLTWNSRFAGRLTARLGRLEIPRSEQQEIAATLSTGPTTLPAMDIEAKQFVLGGLDLGALKLVARNSLVRAPGEAQPAPRGRRQRVWRLETLRLTNPAAELDATGVWDRATDLRYTLRIHDAGAFLDRLQLEGAVRGGSGELAGELRWNGTPFSMDLPTLAGHLDIKVRSGQFLKVEPGAAKLIGVLNLQALPRILSLDFRDIFARGFAFDELGGIVDIDQGVARTDSLAMRGLQAVVRIKGEADLRASTQDLRVLVIPELSGGLATLAYAAIVNPAVGLGAFLAQSIFSQPLSKAFAHEFEITGSWANPTVIQRRREPLATPMGE